MKTCADLNNDAEARVSALNTGTSFIVQAPAGSGKTELLIQRYLALLATVSHPEEVLAITFTRKAAAEIQNRVIETLQSAYMFESSEPHHAKTYTLAKQVVERSRRLGWELLENPNRLYILTIDALSHKIALQMPRASGLGTGFQISDDTSVLYQKAALELLLTVEENEFWHDSLKTLLGHLHNQWDLVVELIAELLSKRDQWMPHVICGKKLEASQIVLEQGLKRVVEFYLRKALSELNAGERKELLELLQFARHSADEINLSLPLWKNIAHFLLSEKGTWRKTANAQLGFPAPSSTNDKDKKVFFKGMKERFGIFLSCLENKSELRELLMGIRLLPGGQYTTQQWKVLKTLMQLLSIAVAFLKLQFKDRGVVDFVEVGEAARKGLGGGDFPSSLALKLDYQISHILIDEFQDTSFPQIRLLKKIVMGWEPNDGRTLFLVGDPMQSIYRFRQAEVGIFLQIQKSEQFFHLPLKRLHLHINYRSSEQIVDWVNKAFMDAFPLRESSALGAVTYCRSQSFRANINAENVREGVFFHPIVAEKGEQEALQITNLVSEVRTIYPNDSVAILARARQHLEWILKALRAKELPYLAVDIECAFNQPVIQDLLILLRAILSTADSIAWLSLLRSPLCGLSLNDLCVISEKKPTSVWSSLNNKEVFNQLSEEGKDRTGRFTSVFHLAFFKRYRHPLPAFLKEIWILLGGPAALCERQELTYAKLFFDFLEKEVGQAHFIEIDLFQERLSKLFVPTFSEAQNPIQLMTIHKAKGLEFDHVILPGLERKGAVAEKQLLLWLEHPIENGSALLMSALYGTGKEIDPLYQFLRYQIRQKEHFELARLFYVAATRARKDLHLFASNVDNDWERAPENSFLELLLPALPITKTIRAHRTDSTLSNSQQMDKPFAIHRISRRTVSGLGNVVTHHLSSPKESDHLVFPLEDESTSRAIGTLLHRILRLLAEISSKEWGKVDWQRYRSNWHNALLRLGVPPIKIKVSLERVYFGLHNVLTCPKAAWVLDSHLQAFNEYRLTGVIGGEVIEGILDRTFVDKIGTRWIIDYKTTEPKTETREQFYQFQKDKHQPQLMRYARILKLKAGGGIRLGLYFPFIQGWCEWDLFDTDDSVQYTPKLLSEQKV